MITNCMIKIMELRFNLVEIYNKYMEDKIETKVSEPLDLYKFSKLEQKGEAFSNIVKIAEELEGFMEATEDVNEQKKEDVLHDMELELRKIMKEV